MASDKEIWLPPLSLDDQYRIDKQRKREKRKTFAWVGFKGKTLWDWLLLLAALAVPIAVAWGTTEFSASQNQISIRVAQDQQQETALQNYLNEISDLLLNQHLGTSKVGDEVRAVARSFTLTILPQLNGTRKGEVIRFLYDSGLINTGTDTIIDLDRADLSHANLSNMYLSGASFRGVDLDNANMAGAMLVDVDFTDGIENSDKNMTLYFATDLEDANLEVANLSGAKFGDINLICTDFYMATMPDGSRNMKYPASPCPI